MNGFGDFGRALPRHKRGCTCVECQRDGVKVLDHQGFFAATFEKTVSGEAVQAHLTRELETLAQWIREENGLIGHIKAAISAEGQSITLSITKDTVRTQGAFDAQADAQVSFAAIVAKVDREQLRHQVEMIYQTL